MKEQQTIMDYWIQPSPGEFVHLQGKHRTYIEPNGMVTVLQRTGPKSERIVAQVKQDTLQFYIRDKRLRRKASRPKIRPVFLGREGSG